MRICRSTKFSGSMLLTYSGAKDNNDLAIDIALNLLHYPTFSNTLNSSCFSLSGRSPDATHQAERQVHTLAGSEVETLSPSQRVTGKFSLNMEGGKRWLDPSSPRFWKTHGTIQLNALQRYRLF